MNCKKRYSKIRRGTSKTFQENIGHAYLQDLKECLYINIIDLKSNLAHQRLGDLKLKKDGLLSKSMQQKKLNSMTHKINKILNFHFTKIDIGLTCKTDS